MSNHPIQVRSARFLVFDADARPIHVGDTLEWQETAGRYGETKRGRGTVTEEMTCYNGIVTDGGTVCVHWEWQPKDGPEGLYCRHENHTYDHGHKTWARVVASEATSFREAKAFLDKVTEFERRSQQSLEKDQHIIS